MRFVTVGLLCTALNLGLFALLQRSWGNEQAANLVALIVATLVNTALNRAWTFGVRGSHGLARHHLQSLGIFGLTWALTAGSLGLLTHGWPSAPVPVKVGAVIAGNLVATVVRYVAMRWWIFRPDARQPMAQTVVG